MPPEIFAVEVISRPLVNILWQDPYSRWSIPLDFRTLAKTVPKVSQLYGWMDQCPWMANRLCLDYIHCGNIDPGSHRAQQPKLRI